MHYRDGTEAQVGDIVTGRGYNLPYLIVGPVTQLIPANGDACNLRVEVRVAKWHDYSHEDGCPDTPAHFTFETYEEAGAVRDFELVYREGWKQTQVARSIWLPKDARGFVEDERGRRCMVVEKP
jgi:hypothetical protein